MTHFVAIPKSIALARGLKFFQTLQPCKNGHCAERYVKGGLCAICRSNYSQKHYQQNRDHVLVRQRERYALDPAAKLSKNREWDLAHKEWRRKHFKEWREANPHVFARHAAHRRLAKSKRIPPWFAELDEFVEFSAAELATLRERATGIRWAVDHMLPLQAETLSGLHCANNLQVIPHSLNSKKHNKLWLTEPGQWISQT